MNEAASYHRALGGDGLTLIGCEFEEDSTLPVQKKEKVCLLDPVAAAPPQILRFFVGWPSSAVVLSSLSLWWSPTEASSSGRSGPSSQGLFVFGLRSHRRV